MESKLVEIEKQEQIIDKLMADIEFAFNCKKPSVICSHRVNYVGGIEEENRKKREEMLLTEIRDLLKTMNK